MVNKRQYAIFWLDFQFVFLCSSIETKAKVENVRCDGGTEEWMEII